MTNYRNDHTYVKRREALRRAAMKTSRPCHLCGEPINYNAPYTDRLAFTADHIDAIAAGGSMVGALKPAHRACNSRRQDKPLDEYMASRTTRPTTGTQW